MCNFCNNITDWDRDLSNWYRDTGLYYNDNEIFFWVECDDCYYSHAPIRNIQYCPICGRKIDKIEKM